MELMQIKVSSKSEPQKVAGMIVACIMQGQKVQAVAIGAGAINQTIKAIATARGYLAPVGINLSCIPAFTNIESEDQAISAIKFILNTS